MHFSAATLFLYLEPYFTNFFSAVEYKSSEGNLFGATLYYIWYISAVEYKSYESQLFVATLYYIWYKVSIIFEKLVLFESIWWATSALKHLKKYPMKCQIFFFWYKKDANLMHFGRKYTLYIYPN